VLSVPAAGAITATGDGVTGGSVLAVARLRTTGSVVVSVARHVALVATESHTALALTGHRVTHGVAATLAVIGAVLAVAASWTRCPNITSPPSR